eukprot:gnl/TRDRNA2_/TRDRNA2_151147_c5_seq1.p2 gnl/TRDRNA2_/TRDRNA2_151147_c5~~gnl/TRDRNA2_/TRDRNA2_151147_c5_seq1.p2  ORF type:complete len:125 (+),score=17.77 gnl/TRDRNA2_/TRDRNA2_151147_c5_seq1:1-375(+)
MLVQPRCLGLLPREVIVILAVAAGTVVGCSLSLYSSSLWRESGKDLESEYRLLLLLPQVAPRALRKASAMISLANQPEAGDGRPVSRAGLALQKIRATKTAIAAVSSMLSRQLAAEPAGTASAT